MNILPRSVHSQRDDLEQDTNDRCLAGTDARKEEGRGEGSRTFAEGSRQEVRPYGKRLA